ncbi:beta-ketoacyl-[acyl-carrier-protein] synthase family protein [Cryobacterium sp. TMS1-20-1]|uniref:beta-ketoacyl-[acyl-carrier-protein] synthase family protein n=1 Tax=Cryobacterium sp. TMS1-20-1 TaxID=1259223 RepID=UPI00106B9ADD|nr:beta-ketoacyl-[acyl-carrier-protein] synthase family protein [Cryobacterium sp. TMS1-20-1]TFC80157.1 beta-ketoacyl-[acyl-carrier-protein] synthase family protein [Cryobacterium sp. TMS1-20-1]
MSDRRRVVITGLGAITPSGLDVPTMWDAVRHGRSAITTLDDPEFADLAVRIGGQVHGFEVSSVLAPSLARRLSRSQHWAVAAADQALAQAGWTPGTGEMPWDPHRFAVIAATGSGPVNAMQHATRALDERGPRAVPLTLAIYGVPDAAAALLSQRYQAFGPAQSVSATCASGAIGLGEALRRIRHGYADAVLVVGVEDCLNPVNLASNANIRALAAGYEHDPAAASRPFDRARSGFVMSAGAAAILLESEEGARTRRATVLAQLAGFGAASDAYHPTAPHPQGRGAAQAVRVCLADAGVTPDAVDHINAHGTGTPTGDAAELNAMDAALGDRARSIPISATKSSTGHLLGASGVVEAIIAVQSLRDETLPPTRNLDDLEFAGWDIVAGKARRQRVDTVLSNSFGFGGHNGAVLIRRANA